MAGSAAAGIHSDVPRDSASGPSGSWEPGSAWVPDTVGLGEVLRRAEQGERQHQPADGVPGPRPDHDQGDGHDAAVDDQVADRDVRLLHARQAIEAGDVLAALGMVAAFAVTAIS